MSYFDVVEASISYNNEEVLSIKGQVKRLIIPPYRSVLITDIKFDKGIAPPYNRKSVLTFTEFIDGLYEFRDLLDKNSGTKSSDSRLELNLKRVLEVVD
ncbi:MAG: hypothetical protein KJ721_03625 [Nanoarchaeota archaeon]|nr:hypothetical protein [Nanoarchaeota archaeon]